MKPLSPMHRDYDSMRQELLGRIPQLTDRWTDFNPSDLGIVLLELFAGVGDMLAYYLDAQTAEAFLPTARQRQSLMNLCKLIAYPFAMPVTASTTLRFELPQPLGEDLVIPQGTRCRAQIEQEILPFETVEPVRIVRGRVSGEGAARQGQRETQIFTGTGQPHQRVSLAVRDLAQGGVSVGIESSNWSEVRHFQDSDPGSRHFLLETDALDQTRVVFGDGVQGAVPPQGAEIQVEGLRTAGSRGNLAKGLITEILDLPRHHGSPIPVTVSNPIPASGGTERESEDQARTRAPAALQTLWKAVTLEDYQTLTLGFPGVAKVQVLDHAHCQGTRYYQVHLVVAPEGGGPPSPLLIRELRQFLEHRKCITTEILLHEPVYMPIAVDADVYIPPHEDGPTIQSRVAQALAAFFAFERVGFGQSVHRSDVIAVLDGVPGVSHVHLNTPAMDLTGNAGQLPVLGDTHLPIWTVAP